MTMKQTQRILIIFLVLCLCIGLLPMTVAVEDPAPISTWAQLQAAINKAATDGQSTTLLLAKQVTREKSGTSFSKAITLPIGTNIVLQAADGGTTITRTGSSTAKNDWVSFADETNGEFIVPGSAALTIKGTWTISSAGTTKDEGAYFVAPVIQVREGGKLIMNGTLTFGRKILDPKALRNDHDHDVIECAGTMIINDGGGASGCQQSFYKRSDLDVPCAISVEGETASLTMNGGTVSGNVLSGCKGYDGAAIRLRNGASFIMNNGEISGNGIVSGALKRNHNESYAPDLGGGVYVGEGCTFTMSDGVIRENWASHGGGVYVAAGGRFIMKGGSIENNKAHRGGVAVLGSFAVMATESKPARIISNGGVAYAENTRDDLGSCGEASSGGGVYCFGTTAVFNANYVVISQNSTYADAGNSAADAGGNGIYAAGGANIHIQNSVISDNFRGPAVGLVYTGGGGIALKFGATAVIENTRISGNDAMAGAGIYAEYTEGEDYATGIPYGPIHLTVRGCTFSGNSTLSRADYDRALAGYSSYCSNIYATMAAAFLPEDVKR